MGVCVYCGTADGLNTSFTIMLDDGTKADVLICDVHAEDATVKTAKAAYQDKQKQIEVVMAQAKLLGLDIAPASSQSRLVLAQAPPTQRLTQPAPTNGQSSLILATGPLVNGDVAPLLEDDDDGVVVSTDRMQRAMHSVGGTVHGTGFNVNVDSHASHNLSAEFKDNKGNTLSEGLRKGKAKITMVEGRAGMPVAIPTVVQDGTGTTRIKVKQEYDGPRMDRRFRDMAGSSREGQGPDFRNNYEESVERICPICRGQGSTVNRGLQIVCPKCKGQGTI